MNLIKNYLDDNIFTIDNFLTEEECAELLVFCKDPNNWITMNKDSEYRNKIWDDNIKFLEQNFEKIHENIFLRLHSIFNEGFIHLDRHVTRLKPLQSMPAHTDEPHNGVLKGIVMYINDDYSGGELNYPEHNLNYKPKARSLACHPSTYLHEVTQINNNNRYYITGFIKEKNI
mgnify:CR=1 FL=1